jgi:hypothetical protein
MASRTPNVRRGVSAQVCLDSAPGAGLLVDCRQVFKLSFTHELINAAHSKFLEMGRRAMEIQGLAVSVLLVNHNGVRIVLDRVCDVGYAARLLSRGERELTEQVGDLFAIFRGESHFYEEANHTFVILSADLELSTMRVSKDDAAARAGSPTIQECRD